MSKEASAWGGETRGDLHLTNPTENPASDTQPYSGRTDTSMNNVAPYRHDPNPRINTVDPYGEELEENDEDIIGMHQGKTFVSNYRNWDDETGWFDGTSGSIYDRIEQAKQFRTEAKKQSESEIEFALTAQIDTLTTTAHEYDDMNQEEYISNLPGGTVALEYGDLTEGGLVSLDIDDGSFITSAAREVVAEAEDYDWTTFSDAGAEDWVREKARTSAGMLEHELLTREAAVDYVRDKTMILMDPAKRAHIIDAFVTNVERHRREAASELDEVLSAQEQAATEDSIYQYRVDQANLEPYDDTIPVDSNPKNVGEDDGSLLYAEAHQVIAEADGYDWDDFATLGAEEWVQERAADSPDMLVHPDVTAEAAIDFAEDQTARIFDASYRDDIIDTFVGHVAQLRQNYAKKALSARHKLAAEVVEQEEQKVNELGEIIGNDDEFLW